MADQKLTALDAATTLGDADLIYVVDDVAGTPASKKLTGANLKGAFSGDFVGSTGDQTVAGVKTFTSSPIVPAPTTDLQAATKKYVDDNGGGVAEFTPLQAKPTQPVLDIPTYDGNPSVGHPDVLFFPEGWNGWRYWMAFTPYPDEPRENPSILVSQDGVKWVEPEGITNPIVPIEEIADGTNGHDDNSYIWNSDTDLVQLSNGDLACYYRPVGSTVESIYRKTSSDGVNWSTAQHILTGPLDTLISPAIVVEEDGSLTMWIVDASDGREVNKRTSTDDGLTWTAPTVCAHPSGPVWHIDAVRTGDEYHLLVNLRANNNEADLTYWKSTDGGDTWAGDGTLIPRSGLFENDNGFYRSTFVHRPDGGWDIWANVIDGSENFIWNSSWRLMLFQAPAGAAPYEFEPNPVYPIATGEPAFLVPFTDGAGGWNLEELSSGGEGGEMTAAARALIDYRPSRVLVAETFDSPSGSLPTGWSDHGAGNWQVGFNGVFDGQNGTHRTISYDVGTINAVAGVTFFGNGWPTYRQCLLLAMVDVDNYIMVENDPGTPRLRIGLRLGGSIQNPIVTQSIVGLPTSVDNVLRVLGGVSDVSGALHVWGAVQVDGVTLARVAGSFTGSDRDALASATRVGLEMRSEAANTSFAQNFIARKSQR